ncbi:hypothetical protein [Methanolapillus africanus]|uniref:hypothetical protein n=1 Tax=Methanolapillus africanus TaxID=3028297 RepID=UPI0030B8F869
MKWDWYSSNGCNPDQETTVLLGNSRCKPDQETTVLLGNSRCEPDQEITVFSETAGAN